MYVIDFEEENKSILSKIKNFIFNIYWALSHPSSYLKRIIKGKKNYVKSIYLSSDVEGSHEHVCFAIRLLGKNYKYFCPYYNKKDFEPEWCGNDYDCEDCQYYGMIYVEDNKLKLRGHPNFLSIFSEELLAHMEKIKKLTKNNVKGENND